MKTMILLLTVLFIGHQTTQAQSPTNQSFNAKEYTSLKEALKNPKEVLRLNLSNQKEEVPTDAWSKFVNLEYLSLKNDHLKTIPSQIGTLKKLKVLDLSGNDFTELPIEFSQLENLEELYLNDEKNMNLPKTIEIMSKLPKLKSLHLENDQLENLPNNFKRLDHLEFLYLSQNRLKEIPKQIESLPHLQYLDIHDNNINPEIRDMKNLNFGFKINF